MARDTVLLQVTRDFPALRQPGYGSKLQKAEALQDLRDTVPQVLHDPQRPGAGNSGRPKNIKNSGLETCILSILPTRQDIHFPDPAREE